MILMSVEEDIISLMQARGPLLPVDVAKHIKTNIIVASAYLSELASRKKVKISSLKVGGSPVYSLQGQEDKLEKFAQNLNEKDLRAYDLLKQNRVLRDSYMTPLMRVALRSIKDFSVPINVTFGDTQELFWKWYNVPDDEIKLIIQREIEGEKPEAVPQVVVPETVAVPLPIIPEPEPPKKKKKNVETKKEEPLLEVKAKPQPPGLAELAQKHATPSEDKKRNIDFEEQIYQLFKEKGIKLIGKEIIKEGAEANFVIDIPSSVGMLRYLCKARNKRSSTEKDLSSALVDGQLQKMPVVYVHLGKLNPKAQKLLKTEPFKTMVVFPLDNGSKTQKSGTTKTGFV